MLHQSVFWLVPGTCVKSSATKNRKRRFVKEKLQLCIQITTVRMVHLSQGPSSAYVSPKALEPQDGPAATGQSSDSLATIIKALSALQAQSFLSPFCFSHFCSLYFHYCLPLIYSTHMKSASGAHLYISRHGSYPLGASGKI
jgi:hypothetical protein